MSGKKFDSIDALVDDIKANYREAEIVVNGNRFNDKYRVTNVMNVDRRISFDNIEKLKEFFTKSNVKIIFLVAEETNG